MKSIANQYRDLKEGRMTQSNFMRNLRMSMPQYITNVTSFNDAVKILRNKAILTEAEINELSAQTKYNAAMKAVDRGWSSSNSDSNYKKAISQGTKFIEEIDPVLKKTVEDFGRSLGFETKIEKGTTGFQYEPIVQIIMGNDLRNPEIRVVIKKDTDKVEGGQYLPDEAAERRLGNLIKQIQQKELDVELKETLNENSRAFDVAKALKDKYQMDAEGIYVYLIDDMGLDNMTAQSVVDQLFGEDGEDGDEMDDLINKIGQEEEEEKAIKGGFGIYDPMEENQDEDRVKALANNYFPRNPEEMAELVAKKHGDDLKQLLDKGNSRAAQKLALSHAYKEILDSGHPKAKIIAPNLVWGYADEDWPMDYISTLFPILRKEDLKEGKKKKEKKELHPNAIHPQELRMGIKVELEHTDDLDKAKKIALDHLAENPFYYTALKLSGIESPSAPKVKAPTEKKAKKKKEAVELVDKANAMQKVKMPKIVKENLGKFKGEYTFNGTLNKDEKEALDKILSYKGEYEIDVDEVDDHYETTIYHTFYNELNLKDAVDQVTGRKPQKKQFGDTIGFGNVLQSKLEALVREVLDETFDGRDNLANITDDTK